MRKPKQKKPARSRLPVPKPYNQKTRKENPPNRQPHDVNLQIEGPKTMKIAVACYKSIFQECEVEIRPLTLLSGANSAGKSSMFQPLLLLKQTLEETYDPGALLLNGNNVKFTSADQLLWKPSSGDRPMSFTIRLSYGAEELLIRFEKQHGKGFDIPEMICKSSNSEVRITPNMTSAEIKAILPKETLSLANIVAHDKSPEWIVKRHRCFLMLSFQTLSPLSGFGPFEDIWSIAIAPALTKLREDIRNIIHLPGLRGNPERNYPVTAVGSSFSGTFENYTASIIADWADRKSDKLKALCDDLKRLNLTTKVTAQRINDAQVELQVGRMPQTHQGEEDFELDMVNIADVGFGMSQTLPVVVALHAASPGQIVYIEQPELHLHPRAQVAMAEVLARAAQRGVRVVAETHSSLILMGVQTLVAEQKLDPDLVKLHWFTRNDGFTQVTKANLDSAGRFGDWPVDFDDVSLEAQSRYLDAADEQLAKSSVIN